MNVLLSWIRNNEPVTGILDFIELPKSHSGENMAKAFFDAVTRYGIAHKVSNRFLRRRHRLITNLARLDWLHNRRQRIK
jgi:hypothetical protein